MNDWFASGSRKQQGEKSRTGLQAFRSMRSAYFLVAVRYELHPLARSERHKSSQGDSEKLMMFDLREFISIRDVSTELSPPMH